MTFKRISIKQRLFLFRLPGLLCLPKYSIQNEMITYFAFRKYCSYWDLDIARLYIEISIKFRFLYAVLTPLNQNLSMLFHYRLSVSDQDCL